MNYGLFRIRKNRFSVTSTLMSRTYLTKLTLNVVGDTIIFGGKN